MVNNILNSRHCGVLIHPTSFPSPFGIGDLGAEARQILKMLSDAKVTLWQILPLGPTGYGDSPYSARSTFAGNELLIDIRSLCEICPEEAEALKIITDSDNHCTGRVDYPWVYEHKLPLLKYAASLFINGKSPKTDYKKFCSSNAWWLDDYSLYQALVHEFNDSRWFLWEPDLRLRKKSAVTKWTKKLADEIEIYKVLQFFFYTQWNSLHEYANSLGISIIGDIPFYVAGDSVDAWTNTHLFKIDKDGMQTALAGCPPDYFSADGQLWGNPIYDWDVHQKDDYSWWKKRMEMTLNQVDIIRIDHFRGFESYWEVPAGETTARNGKWVKGPGMDLLKQFKHMNVIGEDLGLLTQEVRDMQKKSGFPGMKIIQFAWDFYDGRFNTENAYLPHNYEKNCVAYTGTHDNQTSQGWFNSLPDNYKDIVRRYFQCPDSDVVWQMIRGTIASVANTAIIPMQDIMGLDDSARMNLPSSVGSANWSWRYDPSQMQGWMMDRLREMIEVYGREVIS